MKSRVEGSQARTFFLQYAYSALAFGCYIYASDGWLQYAGGIAAFVTLWLANILPQKWLTEIVVSTGFVAYTAFKAGLSSFGVTASVIAVIGIAWLAFAWWPRNSGRSCGLSLFVDDRNGKVAGKGMVCQAKLGWTCRMKGIYSTKRMAS